MPRRKERIAGRVWRRAAWPNPTNVAVQRYRHAPNSIACFGKGAVKEQLRFSLILVQDALTRPAGLVPKLQPTD